MADPILYLKATVILLVLWRILTIGAFGQVISGILAATLAFSLSRDSTLPKSIQEIAAPLDDLKRTAHLKLAASLIIDVLSTEYIPMPVFFKVIVGQSGFIPIGTFLVQYLYDRPVLSGIAVLRTQLPFAKFVPTATLGWLIENKVIKEQWLGGPNGPFIRV